MPKVFSLRLAKVKKTSACDARRRDVIGVEKPKYRTLDKEETSYGHAI
jgi:hypothetical protein